MFIFDQDVLLIRFMISPDVTLSVVSYYPGLGFGSHMSASSGFRVQGLCQFSTSFSATSTSIPHRRSLHSFVCNVLLGQVQVRIWS